MDGVAGATPRVFGEVLLPALHFVLGALDSSSMITAISSVEAFTSVIAWCRGKNNVLGGVRLGYMVRSSVFCS